MILALEIVLLVVIVAGLVHTHVHVRRAIPRQSAARQKALDAKVKAVATDAQRTLSEAKGALDEARHVREDTRAIQQHLTVALSDRRIQRLLDEVGE